MLLIRIDFNELLGLSKMADLIGQETERIGAMVAQSAYAHMVEEADKKLHSTKGIFLENLSIGKDGDTFLVILDASAAWIDDGSKQRNMLPDFLKSPKAKTSKKGNKYLTIPFQKNGQVPQAQADLVQTIKSKLADKGIPFDEIEKNQDGSPKEGLLHKMDIMDKQAPHGKAALPVGKTGIPFLQGVRVYQKKIKTPQGESVKRFVGTFRTASSTQEGKGMWVRKATPGAHIFEETMEWIQSEFEKKWAGDLLKSISAKI